MRPTESPNSLQRANFSSGEVLFIWFYSGLAYLTKAAAILTIRGGSCSIPLSLINIRLYKMITMKEAAVPLDQNYSGEVVLLGKQVSMYKEAEDLPFSGQEIDWQQAGARDSKLTGHGRTIVDYQELVQCDARLRYGALVNICQPGSQLGVIQAGEVPVLTNGRERADLVPLGELKEAISAIKSVIPFKATFQGFESAGLGRRLFIFDIEELTIPILQEVIPVAQHFWSRDERSLYLSSGFFDIERAQGLPYCWMGSTGRLLARTCLAELVKIEIWVEPYVPKPMRVSFGGNWYRCSGRSQLATYRSVIPGYNPCEIIVDGEIESPQERGESTDSRRLGLKLLSGSITAL